MAAVASTSVVAYADTADKATHGPNLTTVADLVAAAGGGGGGAPTNADYLVATANTGLSAERVVTDNTEITRDVSVAGVIKFLVGAIAQSKVTNLVTDLAAKISSSRTISTTAPLAGGGDLSADRTLTVSAATTTTTGVVELATDGETAASVVVQGNDSRLSNSRTPTAHAASHAFGSTDVITITEAQVTNLTTDLSNKVPTTRTISTTAPVTGGGDLSTDRTITVSDATTLAKGVVQLGINTDTAAGLVVQANDSRLTNSRTPSSHNSSHITGGSDIIPAFTSTASGLVPLSGGGTANFLRADGTFAAPPAGGSPPTGTGFTHITSGATDAAAKLVDTADINSAQVTYAKIQNVSATDKVLGRSTAGAGSVEELACTAAGRALIDDADAATQRTTLGLGGMATFDPTVSATSATTGTMTVTMGEGGRTITPTGACTFNASGGTIGQRCTFLVTTSGTTSYTLTFGTGFRKVGTLATGTVSARFFAVTFFCYAANSWQEIARTAVQT
jgi:hypothetical protein